MKHEKKKLVAAGVTAAALAGLFTGASYAATHREGTVSSPAAKRTQIFAPGSSAGPVFESGKHDCKGKNECKGQGGCNSGDNGCKGKNSCKGKGGCGGKE